MKKVLSFAIIFGLIVLVGMAAALPLIGSNAGFRNPGNAEIGGNVAIGGSLAVGGVTTTNGVFSDDVSMAAGKSFTAAAGASAFNWSLGTGPFKTTSGVNTIGGGTNNVILNGPVLGVSGKSWTMVGASYFTVGSSGIIGSGGTIVLNNATSATDIAASGTVQAEQITSTDDMRVADDLAVLGKVDVTETVTAEQLTSTDDATIGDALDVVNALTAGTIASDAGITAVTTVQAEQLTSTDDITATDDVNAHDLVVTADVGTATVTASGQVRAEDLYSTDDAYVHDDLFEDGTATLQDVAVNTTLTAGGRVKAEDLYSTDDAYIHDDFAVDGTANLDVLTVNTTSDFNGAMTTRGITLDADSGIGMSGAAILSGVSGTFTAKVQAEDLKSTDDAQVVDALLVGGKLTASSFETNTTSTFDGLTTVASGQTLAITTADKLTVGGVIVPQFYEIPIYGLSAASVDMDVYISTASAKIVGISEVHGVAATGNPTVTVKKCTGTQAPSAGAAMATALNLSTTAETIVTGTPNTDGSQKINATERLTLDFTGTPTALVGGAITLKMQRI